MYQMSEASNWLWKNDFDILLQLYIIFFVNLVLLAHSLAAQSDSTFQLE